MKHIFVFGSNTAGIHGRGAARTALYCHNAQNGAGMGRTGNAYAIPTKGHYYTKTMQPKVGRPLPLEEVRKHVDVFIGYAQEHPELRFKVTRIGCGLAGFADRDMAPLFSAAPANCEFDLTWAPYLPEDKKFWGSH